jgi:hypothetical protein
MRKVLKLHFLFQASLIDTPTLKLHLQQLLDIIGSDATEGACEKAGHTVFSGLMHHSVPLICHS